ncbi:hypothetical protein [Novosphingopyxis sp.]|uniref:hypothetical protein n=1 Tax=Novosphingopyxis sp. TaxID=2709690 RepID=UPI003B595EBE
MSDGTGAGYGNHEQGAELPDAPPGPEAGNTPNKPEGHEGGQANRSATSPKAYPDDDGGKPDYGSPDRQTEE